MLTICKPKLVKSSEDMKHPYRVELWYSNDGGMTFTKGSSKHFNWIVDAEEFRKENRQNLEYDLAFGHLGNGIIVFNTMKEEYGDYQNIAHIDDSGMIHWYVDDLALPFYARKEVNNFALRKLEKFKQEFLAKDKLSATCKLYDDFIYAVTNFNLRDKSVEEIYEIYLQMVCRRSYRKPIAM